MIISKCPGSMGFREPKPESMNCPFCSKEMEIWTDEAKATCPHCRVTVMREGGATTTCLDWCKYARSCVGEELYKKYMRNKKISGGGHAKRKDGRSPKQAG